MGGTERVTDILSSELQKGNKHQCFLAYFEDISPSLTQTYFKERIHLKSRKNYTQLISFIINQNINIIIVQGEFGIVKPIRIVFPEIKIIFAHHSTQVLKTHSIHFLMFIIYGIIINL
mgnify:CR=1 FL=1